MARLAGATFLLIAAASGIVARHLPVLEPAAVVDMQQTLIDSGGILEIQQSAGNVNIIGWEQPQIELTVTKSTSRRFAREDIDQAIAELDRIVVTTDHVGDNHVVIRTKLPSRSAYICTPRGRSKVKLQYTIKVPKQTKVIVRQETGQVSVKNITANVEVGGAPAPRGVTHRVVLARRNDA